MTTYEQLNEREKAYWDALRLLIQSLPKVTQQAIEDVVMGLMDISAQQEEEART